MAHIVPDHEHRYQRLNDDQLFCECGKTKDVNPRPQPVAPAPVVVAGGCCHRHHCWCGEHHYYHPTWSPTIWSSGTTSIGTSPTITFGNVTIGDTALYDPDGQYTYRMGDINVD